MSLKKNKEILEVAMIKKNKSRMSSMPSAQPTSFYQQNREYFCSTCWRFYSGTATLVSSKQGTCPRCHEVLYDFETHEAIAK